MRILITWIKKYWIELIVFSVIGGALLNCLSVGITWINTDSDGAHYILAAKYLTTAHHMSAPLYLLLGNLFLKIPIATEAWRMGLMSMLGGFGTSIFIYLIVRHLLLRQQVDEISDKKEWNYISYGRVRLYALVSALVFGGSALVISQSTIIETYMLSTMCGVMAYYFALRKHWSWASLLLGLGMAIHPFLSFIPWAVMFFAFKEMRNWKRFMITIACFAFYAYIPLVAHFNPNNDMWGNETAKGFFGGTLGMVLMHTGGISIWDLPKRLIDTGLILLASFGLGIVPLVYYFIKQRTWKKSLLWLTLIPILYFITDIAMEVYVYVVVAIAFGSIAVGLGLSKMNKKWLYSTLVVAILLTSFNAWYFDIGTNLDPEMSAEKFYHEELPKIPDGEYFMGGGWTWAMVYLYNKEEGRNIIPISIDALPDPTYLRMLNKRGIETASFEVGDLFGFYDDMSYITKQGIIAQSIAELNNGVWIAKETKPEVYQYEIVPAKGNEDYVGRWIGQEIEAGQWRWKPSNPWLYISGQLEVKEWHHILWANRNFEMQRIIPLAFIGVMTVYLVALLLRGRKYKKGESNEIQETKEITS